MSFLYLIMQYILHNLKNPACIKLKSKMILFKKNQTVHNTLPIRPCFSNTFLKTGK